MQTKAYVPANLAQNTSGWSVNNFYFQKLLPAVHRCGKSNHRLLYTVPNNRGKYWPMQGRSISISPLHGQSVILMIHFIVSENRHTLWTAGVDSWGETKMITLTRKPFIITETEHFWGGNGGFWIAIFWNCGDISRLLSFHASETN